MDTKQLKPIFLKPGEGRSYPMGRISALFKADGEEAAGRYSISEWWLEPRLKSTHLAMRVAKYPTSIYLCLLPR
jgi:hypothetical protein